MQAMWYVNSLSVSIKHIHSLSIIIELILLLLSVESLYFFVFNSGSSTNAYPYKEKRNFPKMNKFTDRTENSKLPVLESQSKTNDDVKLVYIDVDPEPRDFENNETIADESMLKESIVLMKSSEGNIFWVRYSPIRQLLLRLVQYYVISRNNFDLLSCTFPHDFT